MLRVTKLTDYATVLLACLAKSPDNVFSASSLAEQAKLEVPTVSKVLKPLSRAGLVEAFRGSQGGYRLAKPAAEISLYAVVEAMEGRPGMTECSGEHSLCEHTEDVLGLRGEIGLPLGGVRHLPESTQLGVVGFELLAGLRLAKDEFPHAGAIQGTIGRDQ